MSTKLEPKADIVWHGVDVSVGDVVTALSQIRKKFAIEESGDSEHPHPRSCVMTLVAVADTDEEERHAERACSVITAEHPAQAMVIREHASDVRGVQIEGWISTEIQRPQTALPFMCEIITLHVRGILGQHLAALVDPLLVSGVPTYLWWISTPPFERQEFADALRICDALVVDSANFGQPHKSFLGLANLLTSAHKRLGLGDLQWSRLRPWLESIPCFFSPTDRRDCLKGINDIGIDYSGDGRGNRIGASLLTGWFTSALNWKLEQATAGGGGIVAARYMVEGWRPVTVNFRSVPKSELAPGELSAVRIAGSAAGQTFRLTVERDPKRGKEGLDMSLKPLAQPGREDEAGIELASRRAEFHRKNHAVLDTPPIGSPAEEGRPKHSVVFTRGRRRPDSSQGLSTMIQSGAGQAPGHM